MGTFCHGRDKRFAKVSWFKERTDGGAESRALSKHKNEASLESRRRISLANNTQDITTAPTQTTHRESEKVSRVLGDDPFRPVDRHHADHVAGFHADLVDETGTKVLEALVDGGVVLPCVARGCGKKEDWTG